MGSIGSTLRISHKLGLSVCAFAVPIAFLVWALVVEQTVAIRFAELEVAGAHYLRKVAPLQGGLSLAVLGGPGRRPSTSRRAAPGRPPRSWTRW